MAQTNLAVVYPEQWNDVDTLYSNIDALNAYIEARQNEGESSVRKRVAKALRISVGTLSLILNKKYHVTGGRPEDVNRAAGEWLAEQADAAHLRASRVGDLVMTSQIERGLMLISYAARHHGFALLSGESGIGKTTSLHMYAQQHPDTAILLELQQEDKSSRAFMKALFRAVPKLRKVERWEGMSTADLKYLAIDHLHGGRETLLIDEGNYLSINGLESIRSLQQATQIGVVLAGTFDLEAVLGFGAGRVKRRVNDALHRRIEIRKELPYEISRDDVAAFTSLYGAADASAVNWLHERCNLPGRRYGYLKNILVEAKIALDDTGLNTLTADILDSVVEMLEV